MNDDERREWILNQIQIVEDQIKIYEETKGSVEEIKNKSNSDKESWQQTYNRLGNNAELAKVEKKDVFEGEMAQRLGELVSEGMEVLTSDLSKAGSLSDTLDSQISKIEDKIQQLEAEKQSLKNML